MGRQLTVYGTGEVEFSISTFNFWAFDRRLIVKTHAALAHIFFNLS